MDRPGGRRRGDGRGHPGAPPLIESLLATLAALPPAAVYLVLGCLAALENVFPPIPADTAVALGAFLSHRGVTNPWLVFLVTIVANTASATAIYFAARRLGPRFAASRWGARLLPRRAFLVVEGRYVRWGVPAIFLSRMIPGVRAIVPPFAGLIGLPPARALLPIAAASALWYGFVTIAGVALGAEWPRMVAVLGSVNRVLTMAAILVAAGLAVVLAARRLHRRAATVPPEERGK